MTGLTRVRPTPQAAQNRGGRDDSSITMPNSGIAPLLCVRHQFLSFVAVAICAYSTHHMRLSYTKLLSFLRMRRYSQRVRGDQCHDETVVNCSYKNIMAGLLWRQSCTTFQSLSFNARKGFHNLPLSLPLLLYHSGP